MNGQPRVLILGLKWPPETFLSRLIAGLARRGLDVTVAVTGRPAAHEPAPALAVDRHWNLVAGWARGGWLVTVAVMGRPAAH